MTRSVPQIYRGFPRKGAYSTNLVKSEPPGILHSIAAKDEHNKNKKEMKLENIKIKNKSPIFYSIADIVKTRRRNRIPQTVPERHTLHKTLKQKGGLKFIDCQINRNTLQIEYLLLFSTAAMHCIIDKKEFKDETKNQILLSKFRQTKPNQSRRYPAVGEMIKKARRFQAKNEHTDSNLYDVLSIVDEIDEFYRVLWTPKWIREEVALHEYKPLVEQYWKGKDGLALDMLKHEQLKLIRKRQLQH